MSKTVLAGLMAVAMVGFFCAGAYAEGEANKEMVDNPGYTGWSKFKVGTTVKYTTAMKAGENKTTADSSQTLKEVTAEKCVVEVTTKTTVAGMDKPMENTMKMDITAKIAKDMLPENSPKFKELGKGEEEVKIGDKAYKCEWKEYEITNQVGDQKFVAKCKIWTCKEVPGGMVKMVSTTDAAANMPGSKMELTLVEFKVGG